MLFAEQIKAARTLLNWSQDDLAAKSGIGVATLRRLEGKLGPVGGQGQTIWKVQTTLEKAGVIFIADDGNEGPGVRLKQTFSAR